MFQSHMDQGVVSIVCRPMTTDWFNGRTTMTSRTDSSHLGETIVMVTCANQRTAVQRTMQPVYHNDTDEVMWSHQETTEQRNMQVDGTSAFYTHSNFELVGDFNKGFKASTLMKMNDNTAHLDFAMILAIGDITEKIKHYMRAKYENPRFTAVQIDHADLRSKAKGFFMRMDTPESIETRFSYYMDKIYNSGHLIDLSLPFIIIVYFKASRFNTTET